MAKAQAEQLLQAELAALNNSGAEPAEAAEEVAASAAGETTDDNSEESSEQAAEAVVPAEDQTPVEETDKA